MIIFYDNADTMNKWFTMYDLINNTVQQPKSSLQKSKMGEVVVVEPSLACLPLVPHPWEGVGEQVAEEGLHPSQEAHPWVASEVEPWAGVLVAPGAWEVASLEPCQVGVLLLVVGACEGEEAASWVAGPCPVLVGDPLLGVHPHGPHL